MSNQLLLRRRAMMLGKKKNDNILTFTAQIANTTVQLNTQGSPPAVTLEYKINGGGWLPYTVGETITLPNAGDKVKMRGNNARLSSGVSNYHYFSFDNPVDASGDVTSLLNLEGGDIPLSSYCFNSLFYYCRYLNIAPELPSTTLANNCYRSMFYNCTRLRQAPVLPATTLRDYCYFEMFAYCITYSYDISNLNATSTRMFEMNMFCLNLIIRSQTPPTISSTTITGLRADCKIYVPYSADHSILDAYKAKQYWSDRAEYIYELDENGEIPE